MTKPGGRGHKPTKPRKWNYPGVFELGMCISPWINHVAETVIGDSESNANLIEFPEVVGLLTNINDWSSGYKNNTGAYTLYLKILE